MKGWFIMTSIPPINHTVAAAWAEARIRSGRPVRQLQGGCVYFYTAKMIDNQFLLRPDEAGALRELIGSSVARAQQAAPVHVHWFEPNTNHLHAGISALSNAPADLTNLTLFKMTCHALIAKGINRMLARRGGMFSGQVHMAPCLDDESVWDKFLYSITNPVKDDLVKRMSHWGGFSTYRQHIGGKTETYRYYDVEQWMRDKKTRPLSDYIRFIDLKISPLPHMKQLAPNTRQRIIKKAVAEQEAQYAAIRLEKVARGERSSAGVVGMKKIYKCSPRDRAANKESGTRPICYARNPALATRYTQFLRNYLITYRVASVLYLAGYWDEANFPRGSLRPPIIQVVG